MQSPYPRNARPNGSRMFWTDRLVSGLLAAYVFVAFGTAVVADHDIGMHLLACLIGLIPCALLLAPKIITMLTVSLMSLPCCWGATTYADLMQIPSLSDKLLYDYAPFLLLFGLYALVRSIQLFVLARKSRTSGN